MMDDDAGTDEGTLSLSGDVEPADPGSWVDRALFAEREGVDQKAIYRRVQRGRMQGRNNPETGVPEVWVPAPAGTQPGDRSSLEGEQGDTEGEPRHLAVPDPERYLALLEDAVSRAVAPLAETIADQHTTIDRQREQGEELIRENERLRVEGEQREREQERERSLHAAEVTRMAAELEEARRPWWRKLMS